MKLKFPFWHGWMGCLTFFHVLLKKNMMVDKLASTASSLVSPILSIENGLWYVFLGLFWFGFLVRQKQMTILCSRELGMSRFYYLVFNRGNEGESRIDPVSPICSALCSTFTGTFPSVPVRSPYERKQGNWQWPKLPSRQKESVLFQKGRRTAYIMGPSSRPFNTSPVIAIEKRTGQACNYSLRQNPEFNRWREECYRSDLMKEQIEAWYFGNAQTKGMISAKHQRLRLVVGQN